ncbi:helix-turn-helix domain-containing protein, partial [Clostridium sp.]
MSLTPIDSRLFKLVSKINSKQFSKLEELAEFMGVSTRTIQNYIKKLNQIMKSHDAKIVNVKKVGYKLVVEDKKK